MRCSCTCLCLCGAHCTAYAHCTVCWQYRLQKVFCTTLKAIGASMLLALHLLFSIGAMLGNYADAKPEHHQRAISDVAAGYCAILQSSTTHCITHCSTTWQRDSATRQCSAASWYSMYHHVHTLHYITCTVYSGCSLR